MKELKTPLERSLKQYSKDRIVRSIKDLKRAIKMGNKILTKDTLYFMEGT